MNAFVEFLSCGPFTSLQDDGRVGFSRIGLPRSGAMDRRSLAAANMLVGNAAGAAAIEHALVGSELRLEVGTALLAWCGGRARLAVDGIPVADHATFRMEAGQTLRIGRFETGVYGYLAVGGGFAVAPALGSCAVDGRARIGGIDGRSFRAGDRLALSHNEPPHGARLLATDMCVNPASDTVRVVLGPQDGDFTEASLDAFRTGSFTVTGRADRMAYVLAGPVLQRRARHEMVSEPTMPGAVQVPPDGNPIVLMADRQTIGGYPKIATVIAADIGLLAQRRPGEVVRFQPVSLADAHLSLARAPTPAVRPAGHRHRDAGEYRLDLLVDSAVSALDHSTWMTR